MGDPRNAALKIKTRIVKETEWGHHGLYILGKETTEFAQACH